MVLWPRVSPAYAGMAPPVISSCASTRSFPRVRGDGPLPSTCRCHACAFPPRTRGWPRCSPLDRPRDLVSPAYAGMAPLSKRSASATTSFPRVRGDGPRPASLGWVPPQFPPRTRGWPLRAREVLAALDVSPAYAGMAPMQQRVPEWVERFPRVRGDGPVSLCCCPAAHEFPPRTRGWPADRQLCSRPDYVSPAYAGMARTCSQSTHRASSFPRVRGDGPPELPSRGAGDGFPPRTRGWPPS